MTDQQLSTRDLATQTESDDDRDRSLETERAADPTAGANPPRDGESDLEPDASNEPVARDRAGQQTDTRAADTGTEATAGEREPLLPDDQSERFATRWQEIQTSFVDQPRDAVEQADVLVADLMQRLAASFSNEREQLEAQWDRGDDVSTEDLRVALTRYRSFFDRLLSA